jgi:hypothetical protein
LPCIIGVRPNSPPHTTKVSANETHTELHQPRRVTFPEAAIGSVE